MNEFLQILFSGLVAISTIVYAILTWRLVLETSKMRQLQITPDIHAHFEKCETDASFVFIVIENMGYGVAKDVSFEIMKDFKYYDFKHQELDKGVFKFGAKNIYPKQRFRYLFTDLSKRYEDKITDNLELKIIFHDINMKEYEKIMNLTLDEFTGMGVLSPPDSYVGRMAYELKEIKSILESNKSKNKE